LRRGQPPFLVLKRVGPGKLTALHKVNHHLAVRERVPFSLARRR
jgi:hypothetical protein